VRHDYYGALNVTRAANATEIAKKYRRLALHYHPDKLVH
jgi:DnaJ-class molecular chaperone